MDTDTLLSLIHTNALITVLHSPLGTLCLSECFDVQWDRPLYDNWEAIQLLTNFLPDEASILQLSEVDGVQTLVVGAISVYC